MTQPDPTTPQTASTTAGREEDEAVEIMAPAMFDCYPGYNAETRSRMLSWARAGLENQARRALSALRAAGFVVARPVANDKLREALDHLCTAVCQPDFAQLEPTAEQRLRAVKNALRWINQFRAERDAARADLARAEAERDGHRDTSKAMLVQIGALASKLGETQGLLAEACDDLQVELDQRYPLTTREAYPTQQRKYDLDMEVVRCARAVLAGTLPADTKEASP